MRKKRGITLAQAEQIREQRGVTYTPKLRTLRVQKELSQAELARVTGISLKTIQNYEQIPQQIERARIDTLCALCAALGCRIGDILEDKKLIEIYKKVK